MLSSLVSENTLLDGNKRLGLVAVRLFYGFKDYDFRVTDDERFDLIMDVAEGRLAEIEKLTERLVLFASPRLR